MICLTPLSLFSLYPILIQVWPILPISIKFVSTSSPGSAMVPPLGNFRNPCCDIFSLQCLQRHDETRAKRRKVLKYENISTIRVVAVRTFHFTSLHLLRGRWIVGHNVAKVIRLCFSSEDDAPLWIRSPFIFKAIKKLPSLYKKALIFPLHRKAFSRRLFIFL